jgi:hypothetical protein
LRPVWPPALPPFAPLDLPPAALLRLAADVPDAPEVPVVLDLPAELLEPLAARVVAVFPEALAGWVLAPGSRGVVRVARWVCGLTLDATS